MLKKCFVAGGLSPYLPKFAYLQVGKCCFGLLEIGEIYLRWPSIGMSRFSWVVGQFLAFWRMEIRTARDLADTYVNAGWLLSWWDQQFNEDVWICKLQYVLDPHCVRSTIVDRGGWDMQFPHRLYEKEGRKIEWNRVKKCTQILILLSVWWIGEFLDIA